MMFPEKHWKKVPSQREQSRTRNLGPGRHIILANSRGMPSDGQQPHQRPRHRKPERDTTPVVAASKFWTNDRNMGHGFWNVSLFLWILVFDFVCSIRHLGEPPPPPLRLTRHPWEFHRRADAFKLTEIRVNDHWFLSLLFQCCSLHPISQEKSRHYFWGKWAKALGASIIFKVAKPSR